MLDDDKKAEVALNYLASTDEKAAKAHANLEMLAKTEKTILGVAFLTSSGTNGEREYKARTSEEYAKWKTEYEEAFYEYELVKNKRLRAELTIDLWRTASANRRKGNL